MSQATSTATFAIIDAEFESTYSIEVLSSLSGVSIDTLQQYCEQGLLRPLSMIDSDAPGPLFDDEAVRHVRRLEAMLDTCEMNLISMRVIAGLLDEVERLRAEVRSLRRW